MYRQVSGGPRPREKLVQDITKKDDFAALFFQGERERKEKEKGKILLHLSILFLQL